CGAGQVGFSIARYLASENNDITVIDQRPELVRKISDSLDVKGLVGFASHPDMLEQAGAVDADMIIAVTFADEVNLVACQVCHSLFNVPTKIARVRHQSYLRPMWRDLFSRDHMPIDVIISPEIEVARAVIRRLQVPGAIDTIPFADGKVHVIGVHLTDDCPVLNTPLRQLTELFPDLHIVVVAVIRDDKLIVPNDKEQLLPGDDVYFVADQEHLERAMVAFGHEEKEARRMIIAGGGNIGLNLARDLEANYPGVSLKVIEFNRERAEVVADQLSRTVVLCGDVLDREILDEANVSTSEAIIAITNDDEVNILASLLAKRYGCRKSLTLVNNMAYWPLLTKLGVDVVVSPHESTISTILQHVRRGAIHSVHSLRDGAAEIVEADALETSTIVGRPLREINLPDGIIIGTVLHDGEVIIPRGDTVIHPNDRVVVLAAAKAVKKLEQIFSVRLEFF
ncbi:MAG: Trk system potassium transporter TrkA, partial [Proteobacteria bacterium]|nr:Trk system potassium transporter TrkA [Pseudomonadota bacterium]